MADPGAAGSKLSVLCSSLATHGGKRENMQGSFRTRNMQGLVQTVQEV